MSARVLSLFSGGGGEGACFVEFVCPGERTCRVCPEHQYSEPQDQR